MIKVKILENCKGLNDGDVKTSIFKVGDIVNLGPALYKVFKEHGFCQDLIEEKTLDLVYEKKVLEPKKEIKKRGRKPKKQ